ncbi:MAG: tRNA (N(6)-L-threonylcarbamoyladenosine(37)-C(2))-methylthiotransferase [Candidatus Micrarchaeota archaeon]
MRYHLITYGCTLNRADSDVIRAILISKGLQEVPSIGEADVVILNTCTVKGATEQKIMERIRRLNGKPLVVAGCIPPANIKLVERYAPDAPVVGPSSLVHIYDAVLAASRGERQLFLSREDKSGLPRVHESIIARVPIAEGCLGACTFCQTRIARGELVSNSTEQLISEITKCVKNGFSEIQLTAQDTGAYGKDIGTSLAELLEQVDGIGGRFLTRVGMMNPQHLKDENTERLLRAYASPKIYKFVHIPVQSGNCEVLKHMNRFYSVDEFIEVVSVFRSAFPELTLSTDVIVGFPSESEDAFNDSCELMKKISPDIVNISKFTPRPGTPASKMKPLPNSEVKRRSVLMSSLCKKIEFGKNNRFIGKTYEVLLTEFVKSTTGRNINYKQIVVDGELGEFIQARITGATSNYLRAEPTPSKI